MIRGRSSGRESRVVGCRGRSAARLLATAGWVGVGAATFGAFAAAVLAAAPPASRPATKPVAAPPSSLFDDTGVGADEPAAPGAPPTPGQPTTPRPPTPGPGNVPAPPGGLPPGGIPPTPRLPGTTPSGTLPPAEPDRRTSITIGPPLPVPAIGKPVPAGVLSARVARLKSAFAPPKAAAVGPPLSAADPLRGDVNWAAAGNAIRVVGGTIQVGNGDKVHGGSFYKAKVRVEPGTRIGGGSIVVSAGTLELAGTAEQPIVLTNVHLTCEYTAAVTATHVVFDHCEIGKGGNVYWNAGYSAKWVLEDCLARDCTFEKWSRIDSGLRLRRSTFVDCTIPTRRLHDYKNPDVPLDAAKLLAHPWNEVVGCDFHHCKIAASATWGMRGCNLFDCSIARDATNLNSTSDVAVELGFGPGGDTKKLLEELGTRTKETGDGRVTFAAAKGLFANPEFGKK